MATIQNRAPGTGGRRGGTARRSGRWVALLLVAAMFPGAAGAQWAVIDIKAIIESYMARMEDLKENALEAKRWMETYNHYKQQLISGGILSQMAMEMNSGFEERELSYGMSEDCPGSGSGLVDLWRSLSPLNMQGDIAAQQLEVCQQIVLAQNMRFNEMVKMLNTIRQRDAELQQIARERGQVGSSPGRLAANDNQLEAFRARAQMDIDYWKTAVATYDGFIEARRDDQRRLAKRALQGGRSLGGTLVQGAVLKDALEDRRGRDR